MVAKRMMEIRPRRVASENSEAISQDYWPQVQQIKSSDMGSYWGVVLRYASVTFGGIALYFAAGGYGYLVWLGVYLVTNASYLITLGRMQAPVRLAQYASLIGLNVLTSGIFAAMPVYLWVTTEDMAIKTLALCAVAGYGMFNLARHTELNSVLIWDTFVVVGSVAVLATTEILRAPSLIGQICIGIGAGAVMSYYLLAQYLTIRDRKALAASREESLEAMKLSAMGQITAGVAHDFNNKLTVIQGNIDLAALTHDPVDRADRLAEAREATEHAAEVVANMRAFVRKSPLSLSTVPLETFTANFARTLQPHLADKIAFRIRQDSTIGTLTTDAALLDSALMNLALNARDAMIELGGVLELRMSSGNVGTWSGVKPMAAGPYIQIDICDTGPGLPPEMFKTVQEPFYSSKPTGSGTGLGLSMVKGFTEQLGGALRLRNRATGGLEVSMLLPISSTS